MSNFGKRDKSSSQAWFISDRSGMRFRMSEHVIEPGTGYMIHKSESDGIWNMVDHPQANLQKWAELSGDPYPVDNARPDRVWSQDFSLQAGDGSDVIDINGTTIDLGKESPSV